MKAALLTVILLMTLALARKMCELERHVDDVRSDIATVDTRESIPDDDPVTELGFALQWCNEELGGLSHVERDPCRLECFEFATDGLLLDTDALSESVCRSPP